MVSRPAFLRRHLPLCADALDRKDAAVNRRLSGAESVPRAYGSGRGGEASARAASRGADRMCEGDAGWPALPYRDWAETCTALHLWTQIVGKYRLAHTPWVNHSWHATLYVTPRGLTTGMV